MKSGSENRDLLDDFKDYHKKNCCFIIKKIPKTNTAFSIEYKADIRSRGVSWKIMFVTTPTGYKYCGVETTINPQLLLGTNDLIAISNESHVDRTAIAYNELAKEISPNLPLFEDYAINRTDPCINFDISEMYIGCSAKNVMLLLKRGDILPNCKEYTEYDFEVSHRKKSYEHSFYLVSDSFNINLYWKYEQLKEELPFRIADIERTKHLIRFEVQQKYNKIYHAKSKIKGMNNYDTTKHLLSNAETSFTAESYFEQVVKTGDYYTLKKAISLVEAIPFRRHRHNRVIETLKLVSKHKSIARAREQLRTSENATLTVEQFNWSLQDLSEMGINPVTIPRRWKIKHIPNLLKEFKRLRALGY